MWIYIFYTGLRFQHSPSSFPVPENERLGYNADEIAKVWQVLEQLVDSGKIRSLGVCNFSIKKINDLITISRHPVSCNQIEYHIYL